MRYARHVLRPGEEVVAVGKLHWLYTAAAYVCLVVLGIFLVGILIFLFMMIRKWTTEIVVTTDRLIYKTGWIARHAEEIALTRIEEVAVTQTVIGRIFGYGSLRISGTGTSVIHLPSVRASAPGRRRAFGSPAELGEMVTAAWRIASMQDERESRDYTWPSSSRSNSPVRARRTDSKRSAIRASSTGAPPH